MGFYNVQKGDVPYFKSLADDYAMSDNFHQSVNGGTGANHIMLGHGDAIWFSDGLGHPMAPPSKVEVATGTANAGVVDEVENPNPAIGTNNWYTEDGYGGGSFGAPSYRRRLLLQLCGHHSTWCRADRELSADAAPSNQSPLRGGSLLLTKQLQSRLLWQRQQCVYRYEQEQYRFHHSAFLVPSIGDTMLAANVSWKYYGDQWNNYVPDPYQLNYSAMGANTDEYCNICNPFQYDTSIMANPAIRTAHIQDTANLYSDIANGTLPAVSFVKPSALVDGHPASSKLDLFEGFSKKIVDAVKANPSLWKDTAIFITFDEGGGYYDSGYVQPLDFFGDGTRIPLIVVSPYTRPGHISHDYSDHVSILKFIERNWNLTHCVRAAAGTISPIQSRTGATPMRH